MPRQLPPDLARFTGRTDDLAALDWQRAAVVRFLDHHLHSVDSADRVVRHSRMELPLTDREDVVEVSTFRDKDDVLARFKAWRDMLFELCEFALAHGHGHGHEHAWQLPSGLWGCLILSGTTEDFVRLNSTALDAHADWATGTRKDPRCTPWATRTETPATSKRRSACCTRRCGLPRGMRYGPHLRDGCPVRAPIDADLPLAESHVLVMTGDHAEGAKIADEAADVFAALGMTNQMLQNTRARAKFEMGDVAGAARMYRDLLAESLDHIASVPRADIFLGGAVVFRAAGDRQAALRYAREGLAVAEVGKLAAADRFRQLIRELEEDEDSSAAHPHWTV